jgi:hypothetical protein
MPIAFSTPLPLNQRPATPRVCAILAVVLSLAALAPVTAPESRAELAPDALTHLVASDGVEGDAFGWGVAIDGDTAIVGAYADDTASGADSGSAYVYVRQGGVWIEQAQLFGSDMSPGDGFGIAVAVYGDTAIVGAYLDNLPDGGGDDGGSAYVFVRSDGVWTEQAHLFAPDAAAGDLFGAAVALSGDTAAIGAPIDDSQTGAAWVFVRTGAGWAPQARLRASDREAFDAFGNAVAISGDTVIVGTWLDDTEVFDQGSAYVFTRSGSTWSEQQHLLASDGDFGDWFGNAVAIAGDTALVGAWLDDTAAGENAGSAYVFVRSDGVWSEQAHLVPSDGAPLDFFGNAVALAGRTAVVGGYLDDSPNAVDRGSAYVFMRSGGAWQERARLFAPRGRTEDYYGSGIAATRSADGTHVIVGAFGDDTAGGANAGSAYIIGGAN